MLAPSQIALLAELLATAYTGVAEAVTMAEGSLDSAAIAAVEAELMDVADSYNSLKDRHVRLAGAQGVDIDYDRNRGELRRRARALLGLKDSADVPGFFGLARAGL
jgi:hypothetical protein